MKPARILGIILVAAGALSLAYGRVTYTKENHKADIGSVSFSVKEKNTIQIPNWVGFAVVAIGVVALALPAKRA